MPGYKAHITGAAVAGGGTLAGVWWMDWYRPTPLLGAALVAVSVLAGLFPDVDTHSKGRKFFYGILAAVDVVLMVNEEFKWAAILGFCAMLPAVGNHRGWTHTWWAGLLVPVVILSLPFAFFQTDWRVLLPFFLAAVIGYYSHLGLDREF